MRPLVWIFAASLLLSGCFTNNEITSFGNFAKPQSAPIPRPSSLPSPRPSSETSSLLGERNFAKLILAALEARAARIPWAGYWWPDSDGGISEAAQLYETASGKTGAVQWEQSNHGPQAAGLQSWWGHCNGWAAAAALFPEPRESREVGGINFGVADQKALLSEIAMEANADFYGERDESDDPSQLSFQDIFPDEFFLVLTNYMRAGAIVLMDRYTGSQVWNQSIAGYRSAPVTPADVLAPDSAAPGITRVEMTTQVWWARDDVSPDFLTGPFQFKDDDSFQSRVYRYELWLDGPVTFDPSGKIVSSGNIVLAVKDKVVLGGAWQNQDVDPMNSHPDYMWVAHRIAPSTGFSNPKIDQDWVLRNFGR